MKQASFKKHTIKIVSNGLCNYYELIISKRISKKKLCGIIKTLPNDIQYIILHNSINPNLFSNCNMPYFDFDKLTSLLVMNYTLQLINQNEESMSKKTAHLIDLNGEYFTFAKKLLKYFKTLKITTENDFEYINFCDDLFNLYGVEPVITKNICQNDFIINPKEKCFYINNKKFYVDNKEINSIDYKINSLCKIFTNETAQIIKNLPILCENELISIEDILLC